MVNGCIGLCGRVLSRSVAAGCRLPQYSTPRGGIMDQSVSYSRIENEILPKFRKQISEAESAEDLKNFFSYSIQELFRQIFAETIAVGIKMSS